ncbi:MAG: hypothetical protein IPI52_05560 [Bacteroidetes bacterium]|nr:hypothetical protein [Bacteroidota bacterium]
MAGFVSRFNLILEINQIPVIGKEGWYVDAILGIGINKPDYRIDSGYNFEIGMKFSRKVAIDIPTGLNSDWI